jgi:hypothetical protein
VDVRLAAMVALAVLFLGACATPALPEPPVQRALVRDVARVVDVRQKVGWLLDDTEVDGALPDVMPSACRVSESDRAASLAWLDARVASLGGQPAEAWRRAGKDLDKIADLLLFTRTRLVLARADQSVRDGKCPFWIEPEPNFDGTQTLANRWMFGAEAGGRLIIGAENGVLGYGAGGGGRVLLGYGLNERNALFFGLEVGGGARFTSVPIGERVAIPDFLAIAAAPVIGRRSISLSGFVEAEVGPMAYFNQVEGIVEPGLRVGVGIGGSYLRLKRGLLPRFTFGILLDHAPGWNDGVTITQLSAGLRAGFDLSR